MRKVRLVGLLVIYMGIISCSESSVLGEGFIETNDYQITLNKSIPLEFTTVRFDSLITSQFERMLIGGQRETPFGDFEVVTYFMLDLSETSSRESTDNLRYDSITLTLSMDGFTRYLDDETVFESIIVEQLPLQFEYPEDEDVLYNYSKLGGLVDLSGEFLAEKEFFWSADKIRDLDIRFPDELGREMFRRLENDDEIFEDQEEASEFLKGFKVYLKDPNFTVGLSKDSIKLTIHTTDISTSTLSNVDFDFFIRFTPHFSSFRHDNVPSNLVVSELDEEIPSDSLDSQSYIIGGLGYATKIDLTSVRDLLLDGEDFILADAELKLRWFEHDQESYPATLEAVLIDEDYNDLAQGTIFRFNRVFDDEYGRDNYYVLDVTTLIDFILDQPFGGDYYLLLTTENFNTSPTFVMLGDKSFGTEINIYTIKNE